MKHILALPAAHQAFTDHYSLPICCSPYSRQQCFNGPIFFQSLDAVLCFLLALQMCLSAEFPGILKPQRLCSILEYATLSTILVFFTLKKLMTCVIFLYFDFRCFCVICHLVPFCISKHKMIFIVNFSSRVKRMQRGETSTSPYPCPSPLISL